jgi:hypothetical protein
MAERFPDVDGGRRPAGSDVDPLVWSIWAGGVLSVVVVLTLLITSRFNARGLVWVFAVPLVVLAVAALARLLRPGARAGPVAGEPPGGGD